MNCPKCQSPISNENIKTSTDVVACEACKNVFKISDTIANFSETEQAELDTDFDMGSPPKGVWIEKNTKELVLRATTRSGIAFIFVPFTIAWTALAVGGIYIPQIMSGTFDLAESLSGIPFILVSILFWVVALIFVLGKVEITLDHNDMKIFTGIGTLGRTKRFSLEEITCELKETHEGQEESIQYVVLLAGLNPIDFGMALNFNRHFFLLRCLHQIFADKAKGKSFLEPNLSRHLIHKN